MNNTFSVIFDMDGVIFDSERVLLEECRALAEKYCMGDLTEPHMQCIGVTAQRSREIYTGHYGPEFPYDAYNEERWRNYREKYKGGKLPKKPGIEELLEALQERGCTMAVASSSLNDYVVSQLRDAGLLPYYSAVVSGEMVTRSKPAPDIFLKAAALLGCEPGNTWVIEDSYNGIRAAKAAGMHPVMVPDLLPPTPEMEELAEYILPDLHAVCGLLTQTHKGRDE